MQQKSAFVASPKSAREGGHKWYVYVLVSFTTLCLLFAALLLVDKITGGDINKFFSSLIKVIQTAGSANVEDFNIIIGGLDNTEGVKRTDSIIVAHVSMKNKYASMVFLPRDFRVDIPGHGLDKINAAFAIGGPDLMKKTIDSFLNTQTKYYAIIYVSGFIKLIDALGGVDVCVDKRLKYTDRAQNLYIDLYPGCQHLSGEKAMEYARFRHDVDGDFSRIRRQQEVLKSLSKKAMSTDLIKSLPGILKVLKDEHLLETNIPFEELVVLGSLYDSEMSRNLNMHMAVGVPQDIRGISYVIPDMRDLQYLSFAAFNNGYDPKNKKVKIEVLNGCHYLDMAEIYARRLGYYGFTITGKGVAKSLDIKTSSVIAHRDTPFADAVARLLNAEKVSAPDENAPDDMQVVIGRDNCRP